MKIVVAGGSGFVGEPLVRRLMSGSSASAGSPPRAGAKPPDVVVLSRDPEKVRAGRGVRWNPPLVEAWAKEIEDAAVVINLAGENIGAGRWTDERKQRLVSSRMDSTRALVEAMKRTHRHPRLFISASAVGLYGDRGEEMLDEKSSPGVGFLAELVKRWEDEARQAESVARVVLPRFGVVIAGDGGALEKMLTPFKLGVGGPIGDGKQWMAWVDRDDVLRFFDWAIATEKARGVFNVTSPLPVRNRDFSKALGRTLHRPAIVPAPAFALRAVLGEMADEALLTSQRVIPTRTTESGFTFERPDIDVALRHALQR